METTGVEKDGQVILNGGQDLYFQCRQRGPGDRGGQKSPEQNPYQAISLYLVEDGRPGFSKGKRLDKMGWRSQDTAELFFSQCKIPATNRLGQKGGGFLMLMEKLQQERLVCAMGAVCAAERILEEVTSICRAPMADGKPPARSQAVRHTLVEMTCEATLGRTFVDQAGGGSHGGEKHCGRNLHGQILDHGYGPAHGRPGPGSGRTTRRPGKTAPWPGPFGMCGSCPFSPGPTRS